MRKPTVAFVTSATALLVFATVASAQTPGLVSSGSPMGNTPQNHQNEPAVALDANSPSILMAGANDFVDEQACPQPLAVNQGTCLDRATGVGLSGVYFSFDKGHDWAQPAYTGWTTSGCDPSAPCKGGPGPIHTIPWYFENQLVSFGDPAVGIGPAPDSSGKFSWTNGERAYYANLTTAFSTTVEFSFPNPVFNGFVGIAVSRLDNPTAASVALKGSWKVPVIVTSAQGQTSFYDKEQLWADNASSSQFFGHVYICANDFRSNGSHKNGNSPVPMNVFSSADGGTTWVKKQVTSATTNGLGPNDFGYSGCTLRTDSNGVVYLFAERFANPAITGLPTHSAQVMFKSFDGGKSWTNPTVIAHVTDPCFFIDPVEGRCVMDGYAGARTDLAASPSVSIANGAPDGAGATNEIVDAWADATPGLNHEVANFSYSTTGGSSWSTPTAVSLTGDRPLYAAPAIAPDGSRAYVVYEADMAPWAGADFHTPRPYRGVFVSSALGLSGAPTGWTTLFTEAPGDLLATYPGHDLYQERVGDYIYAAASNDYGVGVWASAANAAVCDAVQNYRESSFKAGHRVLPGAPWPLSPTDCPDQRFGNTDIMSITTG